MDDAVAVGAWQRHFVEPGFARLIHRQRAQMVALDATPSRFSMNGFEVEAARCRWSGDDRRPPRRPALRRGGQAARGCRFARRCHGGMPGRVRLRPAQALMET